MSGASLLFPGPAGILGAAAVKVALAAGVSGNSALLFGRMCSFNGKPFWELRVHLSELLGVSKRTITRYFAALVEVGLIVNKRAPIGAVHPGREGKKPLPFRPWYKWAIGLPEIREAVKIGSKEAYARWTERFEAERTQRVTRSKLGAIIGSIVSASSKTSPKKTTSPAEPVRRRWTIEDIEREMDARHDSDAKQSSATPEPRDTS
jgi:hypothetical protein